ncbi:MAG: GNAT family N-acetyltransferase [Nitrosopumilaceae archaeon]
MIAKREDGFVLAYARWKDFPKLIELASKLESGKEFYQPWMFRKNSPLKIKIGQFLARLSLIEVFGKLIKSLFPYGYAIILKNLSKDGEIIGVISIYNFERRGDGTFLASHADMVADKYQNMGLGSFQREQMKMIAKKEKVSRIWAGVHLENERSLSSVLKQGWQITEDKKEIIQNDKKYQIVKIIKDL